MRAIQAIEDDLHANKCAFDAAYLETKFAYSQRSLTNEWELFIRKQKPLMEELHKTEQALAEMLKDYEWEQVTKTSWNIKRKKRVA